MQCPGVVHTEGTEFRQLGSVALELVTLLHTVIFDVRVYIRFI